MGLYPAQFVARLKSHGMTWFANVSTVAEAKAAEGAGADVVVVQGMEAGGHRGCFDSDKAEQEMVGLMSLVPAVVDAVRIPVVATGGISDGRSVAAALALGASAAQIGSGFLRAPEAGIHPAWAEALSKASPEDTVVSRAFSGRAGPQSCNRVRTRQSFQRCAATGAVSRPKGPHRRDEGRGNEGGRCESHAGLGRPVCKTRARGGRRKNCDWSLGRRYSAAPLDMPRIARAVGSDPIGHEQSSRIGRFTPDHRQ
jgi:NAD(P)H-dependent flavin oxidoreductase YrpB (nitropropane dioxygenase family)